MFYNRFYLRLLYPGLANVGGVCKRKEGLCTSINYERGFYSTCQTGAHELAHKYVLQTAAANNNYVWQNGLISTCNWHKLLTTMHHKAVVKWPLHSTIRRWES